MIPFYARLEDIKGFYFFFKKRKSNFLQEDEILSDMNRKNELVKILIQTLENLGYEY